MKTPAPTRRPKPSEEGFTLLLAVLLVAVLTISLAVALPQISKQIQRDRELETMHRGLQYRRAIRLYYTKFGAYPPSVDALVKTNNIRFLRKKYTDPITGKDDWKPILFGQNKVPVTMGFFGKALGGSTIAGIGPNGGNQAQGTGLGQGQGQGLGQNNQDQNGNDLFDQTPTTSSNSAPGSTGTNGSSGTPGSPGSGTDANGDSGFGSTSGQTGQTFGGGGIIGFEPGSPKQSILFYKKKDHYNQWEFTDDPNADLQMMQGGNTGAIGQPASSTTTPVGQPDNGFGQSNSSDFGQSSGGGTGTFGSSTPPSSTNQPF